MDPYEAKYRKYKKRYLALKAQRQQLGGADTPEVSLASAGVIEKVPETEKRLKVDVNDYNQLIKKLRSLVTCEKDFTDIDELRYNLAETYQTLGKKVSSQFEIQDIFKDEDVSKRLTFDDLRRIRDRVCKLVEEKVVPRLEKLKELQKNLTAEMKKIPSDVNLQQYLDFAEEKNLLDRPVDEIIKEYAAALSATLASAKELLRRQSEEKFIEQEVLQFPMSQGGHQCISACEKKQGLMGTLTGNPCSCRTKPYTTWSGVHTWDYCDQCSR